MTWRSTLKFFVDCRSRQASFAMTNSVFICRAAEESSATFATLKLQRSTGFFGGPTDELPSLSF